MPSKEILDNPIISTVFLLPTDVVVVALGEDVPRGRKRRVRRRHRLPAADPATAAAARAATPSARLRSLVETGDPVRSYGGAVPLVPYFTLARMVRSTVEKLLQHIISHQPLLYNP